MFKEVQHNKGLKMSLHTHMKISIDSIPANVAIYRYEDGDFIIIDFNEMAQNTEQVSKSEIIGKQLTKVFPKVKEFGLFDILLHVHEHGGIKNYKRTYYEDERISGWRQNRVNRLSNGDIIVLYDDLTKKNTHIDELSKENHYLEEAQKIAHFGYWEWDIRTNTTVWSSEVFRIFGEEPQSFEPTPERFLSYLDEESQTKMQNVVEYILKHKEPYEIEYTILDRNGVLHHLLSVANAKFDDLGTPLCMIGTVMDITSQRKLESQLLSFGSIVESSVNEIYIFNTQNLKFNYANQAALDNMGYSLEELKEMTPVDIKPKYSHKNFLELIQPILNGSQKFLITQTVHRRKNGSDYNAEIRLQEIKIDGINQFVAIAFDITSRIQMERKLHKLATIDALTEIWNRHRINEELTAEIGRVKRYEGSFALIMFDVDHFKDVNDRYGHDVGDYVLKELCTVISKKIRDSDHFGRWGGEEFLLILPQIGREQALELSQKLQEIVASHIFRDISQLTISIGVSVCSKDDSKKSLLKRVDDALYLAKNEGRNMVRFG